MSTIVVDHRSVRVPDRFENLEAFRCWARSDDFPDAGRICYLNGELWIDMSKEQFTHNQIKGETTSVLTRLARQRRGRFFPDGYLLSNPQANLSTNSAGSETCRYAIGFGSFQKSAMPSNSRIATLWSIAI